MNEAYLKAQLKKKVLACLPGTVVLRHEDKFTGGVPDMSVTRRRRVAWVEVKYQRRGRRSVMTPLQESAVRALDGLCATYAELVNGSRETRVWSPRPEFCGCAPGFDHGYVVAMIDDLMRDRRSDFELVRDFHRAVVGYPDAPRPAFDEREVWYRLQFLQEEVRELAEARAARDLPGAADALADIVYVALGAAHRLGLPWDEVFSEVHRANMRKTCVRDDGAVKGGVVKPDGWTAPDVARVLRKAGWDGR